MRTPATNHGWGAPAGQEDAVGLLPVEIVVSRSGRVDYSTWQFSDGERRAIAEGANLRLGIRWVGVMPPVSLSLTTAEVVE